jgi:N6-adenosine-specific RNA methylase IME4
MTLDFPDKQYDIIYADPPWYYYGSPDKWAAAGKHYPLMTKEEISALPVASISKNPSVIFMWTTSSQIQASIEVMNAWGFHYRGVAWVWVKTAIDGHIINGQGVKPSFTKPTSELLLVGSTKPKGRVFPIADQSMGQVVLHPRGRHSAKPDVFRQNIIRLFDGEYDKIELFAREVADGWDAWGNEVGQEQR